MSERGGSVTLACPNCPERHRYALRIVRSPVSLFTPGQGENAPREKSLVRTFVCPTTSDPFQASVTVPVEPGTKITGLEVVGTGEGDEQLDVVVSAVQAVTPHNQALYEAGKKLLVESVETGREFCKFMITTCMAAIPVYLGLLKIMLPGSFRPTWTIGILLLVPPVVFMAGASVSVAGYFPRLSTFSLDLPEEIDAERQALIHRRRRFALAAAVLFALAVLLATAIAIWALGLTPGASPTAPKG